MKLSLAFVALAGAAAPPRIELNLEGMTSAYKLNQAIYRSHDLTYSQPDGSAVTSRQDWTEKCAAFRKCTKGVDCNLYSSQDILTESNFEYTSESNCPFPVAQGYDHQDKEVDVTTRIFLVDEDGVPKTAGSMSQTAVDFSKRATYLFKYDATDAAGNHAEQVVFALILDDTEAPFYAAQCGDKSDNDQFHSAITVEAVSDWKLCELQAFDNVDNTTTANIRYRIDYLGRGSVSSGNFADANTLIGFDHGTSDNLESYMKSASNIDYTAAQKYFTPSGNNCEEDEFGHNRTHFSGLFVAKDGEYNTDHEQICGPEHVGKFLVTATVNDGAGVYGHNALNNIRKIEQAVLVRDTKKPVIHLEGHSPSYVECRKSSDADTTYSRTGRKTFGDDVTFGKDSSNWDFEAWTGSESDCMDRLDTQALGRYLPVTTTLGSSVQVMEHATNNNKARNENIAFPVFTVGNFLAGSWLNALTATTVRGNRKTVQIAIADTLKQAYGGTSVTNTIQYDCADYSSNTATPVSRQVVTQDTHAPTLHLMDSSGNKIDGDTHAVEYRLTGAYDASDNTDQNNNHDSRTDVDENHWNASNTYGHVYAEDSCNWEVHESDQSYVTSSWGPRQFNARILGDYVRTYTASDKTGNVATKTRTYTVVDEAVPMITVMPGNTNCEATCNPNTYEATRDEEYTDTGATCHDFVDGELSHAVEVSGEVVNMRIPGTYQINYDCQDLSGNSAPQQSRTIVVKDTSKPVITLLGAETNYVEAGFPYVDAGATATDTLDGDITQYIWTDGNSVTTQNAFYARSSCAGIFAHYSAASDAPYYITRPAPAGHTQDGYHRVLVRCYEHNTFVSKTWKLHQANQAWSCEDMSMTRYTGTNATHDTPCSSFAGDDICDLIGNEDQFLCYVDNEVSTKDQWYGSRGPENVAITSNTAITGSEQGSYVINFHVEDKAGNSETAQKKRTVIVKDTLPPVITLKMHKKLIHVGSSNQYGIGHGHQYSFTHSDGYHHAGDMKNPAGYSIGSNKQSGYPDMYKTFGNPNLKTDFHSSHSVYRAASHGFMAESTATNGWIIGAVASAVAGVALLGMSARKSSVTSVPV
jgi:hypothetical protein